MWPCFPACPSPWSVPQVLPSSYRNSLHPGGMDLPVRQQGPPGFPLLPLDQKGGWAESRPPCGEEDQGAVSGVSPGTPTWYLSPSVAAPMEAGGGPCHRQAQSPTTQCECTACRWRMHPEIWGLLPHSPSLRPLLHLCLQGLSLTTWAGGYGVPGWRGCGGPGTPAYLTVQIL